jgi:hypothetical protein
MKIKTKHVSYASERREKRVVGRSRLSEILAPRFEEYGAREAGR